MTTDEKPAKRETSHLRRRYGRACPAIELPAQREGEGEVQAAGEVIDEQV
jgi:hypothetical protein